MSKSAFIARYMLIIKRLKAKPYSSFKEVQGYVENQVEYLKMRDEKLKMGFSKRTFERDKGEISTIFGIDIEYSVKEKGYFISQSELENMNFTRRMEAFDLFHSLSLVEDLSPYIHLEKRRPQGTEHLFGLLHAIKNQFKIRFTYQKFWEETSGQRLVEPYGLKEFRNRWYVLAKDSKDQKVKTFALDRLTNLEFTSQTFRFDTNLNFQELFQDCFGIISPVNEKPQDVVLSFEQVQGKYIKSLPLHHSQQIQADNDDELRIGLRLCITHDFVMELLSYGESMTVLQPQSLIQKIKEEHRKAYLKYE